MASNVKWYGPQVMKLALAEAEKRLEKAAITVEALAREAMYEPKSGIDYRRPGRTRFHRRSSAPGEAPAAQHGSAGYHGTIQHAKQGPLWWRVGTASKLGPWLARGTPKMKARPHFRPALAKVVARGRF